MARKGRRRKFRRYLKGVIDVNMSLNAVAGNTGTRLVVTDSVTEKAWVSSIKCSYALGNMTPANNAGTFVLYVAHSDYTLAEIEEYIENLQSWEEGDMRQQEVARRKIRLVGTFQQTTDPLDRIPLNDGRPVTTKCGWMLTTGQTLAFVAYNQGTAANPTTIGQLPINGHANLWPA